MKKTKQMDLPELYDRMVAMDELIREFDKLGVTGPEHHKQRADLEADINKRFPDIPTEPLPVRDATFPIPNYVSSPVYLYARVKDGKVLDFWEISDNMLGQEQKRRRDEGAELLPVDDKREDITEKHVDKVEIKSDRVVITRLKKDN